MCRHFAPSSKKATFHEQEETKRESSSSLFEVCERHMEELVVAKFLVGWCCARGVGGVAKKDEERGEMLYRQAAAQGYPAAQFHLDCTISKEESPAAKTKTENKRPLDGSRRPPSKAMLEHSCV